MHSTGKQNKRGHLTGKKCSEEGERYFRDARASAHVFGPWLPLRGRADISSAAPVTGGGHRAHGADPPLLKKSLRLEKEDKRLKSDLLCRSTGPRTLGSPWGKRRFPPGPAARPRPPQSPDYISQPAPGRRGLAALLTARRAEAGPGRPRWRRGCWAPGWTWRPSPRPSPLSRRCAPAWRGSSTAWRMGCGTRRPWRAARRASWPPSRRACTPSAATWGEQPALRGLPPRVGVQPGSRPCGGGAAGRGVPG